MSAILVKGGTVITASGAAIADVLKVDGVITAIGEVNQTPDETIDATGHIIFPGLIDCHVHFREPGFEHKATMKSEAASAIAGGVTCVCEMPNTDPPTVTVNALQEKIMRSQDIEHFDMRFFFGVTSGMHLVTLRELWTSDLEEFKNAKARCCGVKLYLDHSTGDQKIEEELIGDVFAVCGELKIPIIAHCEDPEINRQAKATNVSVEVSAHSIIRPMRSEAKAIEKAVALAKEHNAALHVAHLSTKRGLEIVVNAKKEGLSITCEVAPHHLMLTSLDYDRLGTLGKMNPPLRLPEDSEALWAGLEDGTIDCVATDHAPHTLAEKKEGAPLDAPSGVPGVETALPILLTRLEPTLIHKVMFETPNTIFGLGKQGIVEGASESLVIVDPEAQYEIHAKDLHSKCEWTPFEGMQVKGKVIRTV